MSLEVSNDLFCTCFARFGTVEYITKFNRIQHFQVHIMTITLCSFVFSSYLFLKMYICAKRAGKMIVPPKEMLLSFSIGTFLTYYDVTCRKLLNVLIYSTVKKEQNEKEIIQWRLLYCWHFFYVQ